MKKETAISIITTPVKYDIKSGWIMDANEERVTDVYWTDHDEEDVDKIGEFIAAAINEKHEREKVSGIDPSPPCGDCSKQPSMCRSPRCQWNEPPIKNV